jgi:hypothetical protein
VVKSVAGAGINYAVTTSATQVQAGQTVTIYAQLKDAYGNDASLPAGTVTWSKAAGAGGSFASATSTTNAQGLATVVFTTNNTATTQYRFTATDNQNPVRTGTSGNVQSILDGGN